MILAEAFLEKTNKLKIILTIKHQTLQTAQIARQTQASPKKSLIKTIRRIQTTMKKNFSKEKN
jgi:hypothetical protein